MIARLGSGWQTITADLALILFLVTAQASIADAERPSAPPAPSVAKSETKPLVPHAGCPAHCSGHGECADGASGDGTCTCAPGYFEADCSGT